MRFVGTLIVIIALGAAGYLVWRALSAEEDRTSEPAATATEAQVAARNEGVVQALEDILDEAIRNADRADALAGKIDRAIAAAQGSAGRVSALRADNDAAALSAEATRAAALRASSAAEAMRAYAAEMDLLLRRADELAEQAVKVADTVVEVEESQQAAQRASLKAAQADEELDAARRSLARVRREANTLELDGIPEPSRQPERRPTAAENDVVIIVPADQPPDEIVIDR